LIVLSDGQPAAYNYGGYTGRKHVKSIVKDLEGKGWSVIQIGFGGIGEDSMKDMFTNYMTVEDTNQLPLKLSKLMRKVMKL
jgi:nitric oxide reductase activation protein